MYSVWKWIMNINATFNILPMIQFIGEMREKYAHFDLGIVFSYRDIVNKIKTGKFILKHID